MAEPSWYPSVEDVVAIHDDVVAEYPDTPSGVRDRGGVAFAVQFVDGGLSGTGPGTVHRTGFHLLRLLVANHPFVDANKRTALNAVAAFHALNGYRFEYDDGIRSILKRFGTDEAAVDEGETVEYLRSHTGAVDPAGEPGARRMEDVDREAVRRVAASDREANRAVYDALEDE